MAGRAAAPAARCKNVRRGSFMIILCQIVVVRASLRLCQANKRGRFVEFSSVCDFASRRQQQCCQLLGTRNSAPSRFKEAPTRTYRTLAVFGRAGNGSTGPCPIRSPSRAQSISGGVWVKSVVWITAWVHHEIDGLISLVRRNQNSAPRES
jgi:hypothetical protein